MNYHRVKWSGGATIRCWKADCGHMMW
jgi:hypothetical protein